MMPDVMVGPGLSEVFRILAAYFSGIHASYDIGIDVLADVGIEFANEAVLTAKFGNCEFLR